MRQRRLVDRSVLLVFAPDRHDQFCAAGKRGEHGLAAVARICQRPLGICAQVVLDRRQHRRQFARVRGVVDQLGSHDDVGRVIHCRLGVVGRVEPATSARHDAAVRIGEVLLSLGLGHAEGPL